MVETRKSKLKRVVVWSLALPQAWLTEPCCTNMSSPPAVTLVCANVPLVRELLLAAGERS